MSFPYISRVEISNFRNFRSFEIDLQPSAVVVGENRSGKSNFLHALRLVLDPALPDSFRFMRPEDFWDGLEEPFAGEQIRVRLQIQGLEDNAPARAVLADAIVAESPLTAQLTYEYRPRASVDGDESASTEDDYEFVIYAGADGGQHVGSYVRQWLSVVLLPAERDAERALYSSRTSPIRRLLARLRPRLDPNHLEEVRAKLDDAATQLINEAPLTDLQTRINELCRKIVGSVHSVETIFDFASSDPEQLLRGLRLFVKERQSRTLSDTSLGTLNVLFLTLLLRDLDDRLADNELASTVLAIEEPEAHLHPHLQRLLFRYALRRDHSVLVTTHSPHIASVSPLKSLVALRQDDDEGTTARSISSAISDTQIEDLERYIDVTRAEMLFAKGIIFVEGPAEQFLIPIFARHYLETEGLGSSLDEFGVTICSVNGTDFAPYWRVTSPGEWDIPRVVVTDGDPKTATGSTHLRGLVRAARLVEDDSLVNRAKTGDDDDDVRQAVAERNLFVGSRELELDLLPVFGDAMKETYADLREAVAAAKFGELVDEFTGGDSGAAGKIIKRIERVGKGRFAQRLAGRIAGPQDPPEYVKDAIARIIELVRVDV